MGLVAKPSCAGSRCSAVSTYEEPWSLVTAVIASPEAADELRGAFAAQAERWSSFFRHSTGASRRQA